MGRQQQRRKKGRAQQRVHPQPGSTRRPPAKPGRVGMGMGIRALVVAVFVVGLGGLGYFVTHPQTFAKPLPTVLGTISASGLPVDGIQCQGSESLDYHIHQHLALYDHGKPVVVPSAIGIPGGESGLSTTCLYWLHVHGDTPNIIHVESPTKRVYTLGNFFDIWYVTKDSVTPPTDEFVLKLRAAARKGEITTFVNGKRWNRNYRDVPLQNHGVLTVEIGTPVVSPPPFTKWGDL